MRVVFRADASITIGTGHIFRCLTLARALREKGGECLFISRAHPGHLASRIEAAGFPVKLLPPPPAPTPQSPAPDAPPEHAAWAGVGWTLDAAETSAVLRQDRPEWLVTDHYAFDARWEEHVLPFCSQLMVIDDLADRPHVGQILLDQNLGRKTTAYDALVPPACERLIGPQYALLRPEFAARRRASLARRIDERVSRILILMGGMDSENTVSDVLEGLRHADMPASAKVTVVMGSRAPHLERVREKVAQMPYTAELCVDVVDMAALMQDIDLAISASGLISYELICMGVPSLLIPVSPIQREVALETCRIAEARVVEDWRSNPAARIGAAARDFLAHLHALPPTQRRIATAVDGLGAERVVAAMMTRTISEQETFQ